MVQELYARIRENMTMAVQGAAGAMMNQSVGAGNMTSSGGA